MKHSLMRALSCLLAVMMIFSAIPMYALAASGVTGNLSQAGLTVISDDESSLAPGITQHKVAVYDENNNRVEMFVAVADTTVETVNIYANYKDNQNEVLGMQKTTDQVAAAEKNHEEPYSVVVAINASYYNTTTGKPTGAFVMEGNDVTVESEGNAYPFFAILKDGTAMIGAKGEYSSYKGNIAEAIGGYIHLVKDGKICSGLDSTTKYPRQTIGITEDGKVILMTADGNQAPRSDGLTVQEQAEVMLSMGCVEALHLDGGGSATYCSKEEGSDTLTVVNSPSNGSERAVSNTLMFVSTAVADGTFDHATLTAENNYVTPNSKVNITAIGVDAAGGPAEIPTEGITWQLKDSSMGTVEDGVFTSNGTTGVATVQMLYNKVVVAEEDINVVIPDGLSFGREQLTVPYGETVSVSLTATYGVKEVAFNESDITLSLQDAGYGTLNGFKLSAPDASSEITETKLTATFNNTDVTATVTVKYGKGSEVVFDFEKGTESADIDNWILRTHESSIANNEQGDISIVDATTGLVHDGNQALALHADFSQTTGNGSATNGYIALSISWGGDAVSIKGAQTLGFWLYIPEDAVSTEITANTIYYTSSGSPSRRTVDCYDDDGEYIYTPYWGTHMEESGWHYVRCDLSSFTDDLYIKDEPSLSGAYKRNFFIKIYCVFGEVTENFADFHGDFTYYIDNVTVDYSDAVEDRELPVFSESKVYGATSEASLVYGSTVQVKENDLIFGASVADNTTNTNYSGLDAKTAKVYVDGNEIGATYSNGTISSDSVTLADGYHTVRFQIADNNGNSKTIVRSFNVKAESDMPTVELVAHDTTLDKLLSGSIYWVDLVSDDIDSIKSVEALLDLNSVNEWELDHMVVADGFDATYTSTAAQDAENDVVITFTRNDKAIDTTSNVIASIPVRVWESRVHEYAGHESKTPEYMWKSTHIDPREVRVKVDKGLVTFTDNSSSYFSGNICVDTEAYTHYYLMDATYYAEKGTYHVHTPVALDDVAATCTEDGYTGRTYCKVCDSVVDWGTTVPATGHTYSLKDGKLSCDDCVDVNAIIGLYEDDNGTYYLINGVAQSGWQYVDNAWYYFDPDTLAGVSGHLKVSGVYFDFDEDGKLESGVWVNAFNGYRYYYGPSYYSKDWHEIDGKLYYFKDGYRVTGHKYVKANNNQFAYEWYYFDENGVSQGLSNGLAEADGYLYYFADGVAQVGMYNINGDYYFFNSDGRALSGKLYAWETHCDLPCGTYYFGDDFKLLNGIVEIDGINYYYTNGQVGKTVGLTQIDNDYYFINYDGTFQTGTFYAWATNCDLPVGNYTFGEDGKMLNGIVEIDGTLYLYKNGKTATCGLFEIDGDYYYSYWGGVIQTSGKYYVGTTYCDLPAASYTFGADGKMLNGIVEIDGTLYLYENGKTATCGLFEIDGDYYYSYWGGVIQTSGKYYVGTTYCDLPAASYTFGADGKMLNGIVEIDGTLYLYKNGKTETCGLFEIDGDYYYSYWGGVIQTSGKYYVPRTYCDLPVGNYTFDADGKMLNGIVEIDGTLYLYENGKTATCGLFEIDGDYYYSYWGGVIQTSGKYYVPRTYCDLPVGNYTFGEDGKMLNGIVEIDGTLYLYENGKTATCGLFEIDGDYYYSYWGGVIQTSGKYYVGTTYCDLPVGNYTFGEDGKALNGFVTKEDGIYYYINGKTGPVGLNYIDGYYYFVNYDGSIVVNQDFYVWRGNELLLETTYTFNELGQIIG